MNIHRFLPPHFVNLLLNPLEDEGISETNKIAQSRISPKEIKKEIPELIAERKEKIRALIQTESHTLQRAFFTNFGNEQIVEKGIKVLKSHGDKSSPITADSFDQFIKNNPSLPSAEVEILKTASEFIKERNELNRYLGFSAPDIQFAKTLEELEAFERSDLPDEAKVRVRAIIDHLKQSEDLFYLVGIASNEKSPLIREQAKEALKKEISKKIDALVPGSAFIVPGGYLDDPPYGFHNPIKGHSILYQCSKGLDGKITWTIYNTDPPEKRHRKEGHRYLPLEYDATSCFNNNETRENFLSCLVGFVNPSSEDLKFRRKLKIEESDSDTELYQFFNLSLASKNQSDSLRSYHKQGNLARCTFSSLNVYVHGGFNDRTLNQEFQLFSAQKLKEKLEIMIRSNRPTFEYEHPIARYGMVNYTFRSILGGLVSFIAGEEVRFNLTRKKLDVIFTQLEKKIAERDFKKKTEVFFEIFGTDKIMREACLALTKAKSERSNMVEKIWSKRKHRPSDLSKHVMDQFFEEFRDFSNLNNYDKGLFAFKFLSMGRLDLFDHVVNQLDETGTRFPVEWLIDLKKQGKINELLHFLKNKEGVDKFFPDREGLEGDLGFIAIRLFEEGKIEEAEKVEKFILNEVTYEASLDFFNRSPLYHLERIQQWAENHPNSPIASLIYMHIIWNLLEGGEFSKALELFAEKTKTYPELNCLIYKIIIKTPITEDFINTDDFFEIINKIPVRYFDNSLISHLYGVDPAKLLLLIQERVTDPQKIDSILNRLIRESIEKKNLQHAQLFLDKLLINKENLPDRDEESLISIANLLLINGYVEEALDLVEKNQIKLEKDKDFLVIFALLLAAKSKEEAARRVVLKIPSEVTLGFWEIATISRILKSNCSKEEFAKMEKFILNHESLKQILPVITLQLNL